MQHRQVTLMGLGAWVATPGYILERIRSLGAEYEIVGKELRAQIEPCLPDKPDKNSAICLSRRSFTSKTWTPLKDSWDVFAANHESWYNRLWGATVDVIDEYAVKLRNVRAAAVRAGFVFQSPEPPLPPESSWSKIGSVVKFAVVGGVLIGGLFVVYKFLPTRVKTIVGR